MQIAALRIVIAVVWLTAFVWFTAASNITLSIASQRIEEQSLREDYSHRALMQERRRPSAFIQTYREIQNVIRREGADGASPVECCPTVEEMTEPTGGRNREEMYVELWRNSANEQRFYEYSCRADVLDKPCRFVDKKLMNQTRCVQKFSYSYAIVKDPSAKLHDRYMDRTEHRHRHKEHHFPSLAPDSPWRLDHIRVRSGCSCQVMPKPKKKKAGLKTKKFKSKMRKSRDDDFS